MKILIDAIGIGNKIDGVGLYSLQLLKAIACIDKNNDYTLLLQQNLHESHPIFDLKKQSNFTFKGVNIPSVGPKKQIFFPWILKSLHTHYDLFHSLNSELPLLHKLKSIVTIHDLKYLKYPKWLSGVSRIKASYLKYAMKHGANKASKVITDSISTKRDIIDLLRIEENKIKVIYLAGNNNLYFRQNPEPNAKIIGRYSIKKPYFLYVGAKRPHKNLEGLIKAFAIFKSRYDKWDSHLVIVGSKYSQYKGYLAQVKKYGVIDNVQFTGFVPDGHLKAIYSEAEIFLLVSFYEGFGIPILEAMECGTPVITSNVSSMPEVAGDAAILVNPKNIQEISEKINSIMNSDILKKQLVQKGLKRVKDFSWKITAEKTLKLYNEICKK